MSDDSEDAKRLLELEREQWHRECRKSFIAFCIEVLSSRGESPARHHRLICEALQDPRLSDCSKSNPKLYTNLQKDAGVSGSRPRDSRSFG